MPRTVVTLLLLLLLASACASDPTASTTLSVRMPDADPGIGFDDLQFSSVLHQVIVPAGRSGRVVLVDPDTAVVTPITGFGSADTYRAGSYSTGPTSAVEVRGYLAVLDKTESALVIVNPTTRHIESSLPLTDPVDYVRYVAATNELWLTAPEQERIDVYSLSDQDPPIPTHAGSIPIAFGPEALAIDAARGRAYTNTFVGDTVAIDLATRVATDTWDNGCVVSLGVALDEARGLPVVACSEGKLITLDVTSAGAQRAVLMVGNGLDVLAYSPSLQHVYAAAGASATLSIAKLDDNGVLQLLAEVPTARGAKCVTADDRAYAWVCDPDHGALLRITDNFGTTDR